jgi:hypothetical protein
MSLLLFILFIVQRNLSAQLEMSWRYTTGAAFVHYGNLQEYISYSILWLYNYYNNVHLNAKNKVNHLEKE